MDLVVQVKALYVCCWRKSCQTGTLAYMRQDSIARPDETVADLMGAAPALSLIDRAEAGRASAAELAEADWTLPARLDAALDRCGLSVAPTTPLARLSGGQRTRAALAALLLADPDMLLMAAVLSASRNRARASSE